LFERKKNDSKTRNMQYYSVAQCRGFHTWRLLF